MAWFDFVWTPEIIEHLAAHDVSPEEFEEVVENPLVRGTSRTSDYFTAEGFTSAHRYIRCVYDLIDDVTILPVTAHDLFDED